jgi:hypothetical protein
MSVCRRYWIYGLWNQSGVICLQSKKQINDANSYDKFDAADKKEKLNKTVTDTVGWLDHNLEVSKA